MIARDLIAAGNGGPPDECWEWSRGRYRSGYGTVLYEDGRNGYAHRLSYEIHVGPIPDGLELDHICRNRACWNPAHLEPVTHAENMRRGAAARWSPVCPAGHPKTDENRRKGRRNYDCRVCHRERERRRARKSTTREDLP